jgi:hypothetical protein
MKNQHERTTPGTKTMFSLFIVLLLTATQAKAEVTVEKLPEPGLQPQTVTAPDGTVHLIYLVGDPKAADIQYRWRRANEDQWSAPLRVNSQPGSAIAIGTIRGAQLALGRNGHVHVCWNGSREEPKSANTGAPMLYSRLNKEGKSFSAQKNLMTATHQLDGGGSIAADGDGRVFVFWHAAPVGSSGETNRAVYLALSSDDGKTFAPERRISPPGSGACGCCGLTAFANARSEIFVLFRTARSVMQRDMMLLVSHDQGKNFDEAFTHPWSVGMCPMSSASLATADKGTWAAWEKAGRVYTTCLSDEVQKNAPARAVESLKGAKHPRVVANQRDETLVVWTEGTAWERGGALAWQMFDQKGEPTSERGRRDGIPAWSYAAAFARPDGRFVILQ